MKTCRLCNEKKLEGEFYVRTDSGNLRTECKICTNRLGKKRNSEKKPEIAIRKHLYYEKNKEIIAKKSKIYEENNKDKIVLMKKEYYKKTREVRLDKVKENYKKNSARIMKYQISYKRTHLEKTKGYQKNYYVRKYGDINNVDISEECLENREVMYANGRAYNKANLDKRNAACIKYKAKRRQAMPSWSNEFFIQEAYSLAHLRTKLTGIKWHVDHKIPLRGILVSGLHCEANLQVITARENLTKNRHYWPDMPKLNIKIKEVVLIDYFTVALPA